MFERNFVWDGFKIDDDSVGHVDLNSFNKNIVYGLLQMIYQKRTKEEYRHFIEVVNSNHVPSMEIDPRTMIILAACHHHQIVNNIGLTIRFPTSLLKGDFINETYLKENSVG